ncbi:hypothetical protein IGI04_015871 [Brassica rapa subsp. trilocularis]|uniref:Uncharacterized protein n=1 Tax=Brassica rapa subsp. trilocularis TaxID=1813537 RepID=A0ABQ7MUT7_BRACM|nr:hypothetical protein IGI04_015871 [Brassica rapa subsp. trilocularis]
MKTVRPDEFASPYSATSIISIANIDDNQTRQLPRPKMCYADCLLMEQEETTDIYKKLAFDFNTSHIEVRIVCLWRTYNKESGNTIEMVGTRIHASVGEQLNSSKNSMTSYAREMRLSSSCSKCTIQLVNTVQRHIA